MDNLLIDRETLGQFIDELIKKKPLPVNTAEEIASFREQQIKALDDRIMNAFLAGLNKDQVAELTQILQSGEENPDMFENFYQRAGIDIQKNITESMEKFAKEYLGGQNA